MDLTSLKACHGSKYAAKASKQRWFKSDLNAAGDRQQAQADPLLLAKRPAILMCPGIALLVHRTTTLHDYLNHGMPFIHCDICMFWSQ